MSQFEQDALLAFEDAFSNDPTTQDRAQHCARLALAALIGNFGGLNLYIPARAKQDQDQYIDTALRQGRSLRQIATELGLHRSTVYRRLQRLRRNQREP